MQPSFSKSFLFSSLALALPIFALAAWTDTQPTRWPMPDAMVVGAAAPLIAADRFPAPVAAARLWRLSAPDRRFGGLSGLALDRGELIALTDSGVAVRFAPPARASQSVRFHFHDLPGGPGTEQRKRGRDSEALIADPGGGGWWVAFEGRHSLWRYDRLFARALEARRLDRHWPSNRGAEALIAGDRGNVLALPEGGDEVTPAGTSDATRLSDGRLVLLVRRFGWRGFANELRIAGGAGKPPLRLRLPLGPLDNGEGLAAAPLAGGGTRLWIVTDDNFRPWMRSLLVALDLPPGA